MTNHTEMERREKFEAWAEEVGAKPCGYLKKQRNPSGGYSVQIYTYMWTAWKAAGAELVEALEKAKQMIDELECRMALAAMDSEPVIVVGDDGGDALSYRRLIQSFEPGTKLYLHAQPAPVVPKNCVTAEHRRVIEMLLNVCGAAFELADDSCQQDVDGEDCHVVPDDAFQKLSDALDEIENTLPTEDIDRPDVFLAWSAMPRAALKSLLQAQPAPVIPDEMTPEQAYEIGDYHGDPVDVFARGANWMRQHIIDSTLAAAQQSPGSEPATLPGKWIPVSERIPDNTEPVLCIEKRADFGTYGQPFVCWHDGGGWVGKTNYRPIVTHWMPLPADPQEVK